jgi:hypothetical protein
VRVVFDNFAFDPKGAYGPGSPIYTALSRAGRKVVDQAKRNLTQAGNVDTGRLRQSGTWRMEREGTSKITAVVEFNTNYARWVNDGNGPPGSFIYPRRARVLRFKGSSGAFVYAQRVKAYEGSRYLTKALESLKVEDLGA